MFQRIANLFKGFLSLFVSDMERNNPEALLAAEKENLREQIAQYNQGLASHAAHAERLMVQVRKLEKEEELLKARAAANLKAGNRSLAGQVARQLQETRRQLTENRAQIEQAEVTYKNLLKARDRSVEQARERLERIEGQLSDLKVQRATAELQEMASGMIHEIGASGDTLNRLEEMVEEERARAVGRARVARDSATGSLAGGVEAEAALSEAEEEALGELALAEFAAEAGIALEPMAGVGGGDGAVSREMGPSRPEAIPEAAAEDDSETS